METKTIGSFIAALRKAKGLTQRQLADKLNVSDKAVSRWERDEAMPDLTLIPVLAEIFEVTSDEILRGQRKTSDEPETKYETRKVEQQKKNILRQHLSNYRISSLIAGAIAVVGFIASMIGNTAFVRAYIGFFAGSFFYVGAALYQAILTVQTINALDSDEEDPDSLRPAKQKIFHIAAMVCTMICVLFAASLPLLVLVQDAYVGLSNSCWLFYGIEFALAALVLCLVIRWILEIRLGFRSFHKEKWKLLGHTIGMLVLILVLTWGLFALGYDYAYQNAGPRTQWDDWEELKTFLEEPKTPAGEPMELIDTESGWNLYLGADGEQYHTRSDEIVWVYKSDMETPVYSSHHFNLSVDTVTFSRDEDRFSATTLSVEGKEIRNQILQVIETFGYVVFVVEFLSFLVYYRKKAKQ